jgi:hypothetical protein
VLFAEVTARVPQLLEAMRSVGTGLELHGTLDRICRTAAGLAGARYAAIGVLDAQGQGLSGFVTCGVDEEVARRIGHRPDGRRGLLGALVREPSPVRLTDLTTDPRAAGLPRGHPPNPSAGSSGYGPCIGHDGAGTTVTWEAPLRPAPTGQRRRTAHRGLIGPARRADRVFGRRGT